MVTIEVNGTIVSNDDAWIYDYFEYENACPKKIKDALEKANGDEITLSVNSGGGDVFAGNEIYYLLKMYPGKITADISGIAASIATVICCGADTVRGVPGLQYMIHNVSASASGDYNDMDKASEILKNANKTISNVYKLKTGMDEKTLLGYMNQESWMDANKALELKFIDEVIGDNGTFKKGPFTINNSFAKIIPDELKNKIRNAVKNPNGQENTDSDFLMQKNKLRLLQLKGEVK